MSRKFIASILAASIAVTGISAAPAQASDDDLFRFLAGATALVIIGKAINGDNDHRRPQDAYGYQHKDQHKSRSNHTPNSKSNAHRNSNHRLPSRCLVSIRTNKGFQHAYGSRCLRSNDVSVYNLPNACRVTGDDPRNVVRTGYLAKCMRNRGYQTTAR